MGKFLDLDGLRHLWDKIKSYVAQNGIPGPQGPDGNPTGTVISFMGTAAPEGYLACDGTAHSIEDYPGRGAVRLKELLWRQRDHDLFRA